MPTEVNRSARIAVCSRSFSRHPVLRRELLARFANCSFNDSGASLSGDALIGFLAGHDRAIIALEPVGAQVLDALPDLKVISKFGVGFDKLDLDALRTRGICLGWTPGVNRRAVSELALCMMITLLRHAAESDRLVRDGKWINTPGRSLSDRTVGLIGVGHVGKDLGRLLRTLGARVLGNDITPDAAYTAETGVEMVGLESLLRQSDVISLHVPLNDSTRRIIGAAELAMMKEDAILINTARGGLIDEDALLRALRAGRIAGAGFDVFDHEPPEGSELPTLENFFSTAHLGGSTEESVLAMGRAAIAGLDDNRVPEPGVFPK